jgi:hypothetical protein
MRVYRRPGERYVQCNIAQTVSYGEGCCTLRTLHRRKFHIDE